MKCTHLLKDMWRLGTTHLWCSACGAVVLSQQDDVAIWPSFDEARAHEQGNAKWESTPQSKALDAVSIEESER